MSKKLGPGSVITIPATGDTDHRYVIVAEDEAAGDWLVVPICSHKFRCDETVVIETTFFPGLVIKKSHVAYFWAKKIPNKIERHHRCDLPDDKLEIIRRGIAASSETELWFKEEYAKLTVPLVKKGRILRRDGDEG
jgi:hypothetical protein